MFKLDFDNLNKIWILIKSIFRVWLVQEAGLADRVDESDIEIAESYVYRNLGYQWRHDELGRREKEKIRLECAKLILHFIKILEE